MKSAALLAGVAALIAMLDLPPTTAWAAALGLLLLAALMALVERAVKLQRADDEAAFLREHPEIADILASGARRRR